MSNATNLPLIDDAYLRKVFDTLAVMEVELDSDPLVFGPKRLNAKVALCRDHLGKCQKIYIQLSDDLHRLGRAQRQAKLDFDLQMEDLLANDPEVRSQKNIRDREAVASSKLRAQREMMFRIETSITDLQSVITVVKAKREDLKDIQGRIRDQVKLCQEEIGLGLRWGSAPPPGVRVDLESRPRVDTRALEEFNETLGGLGGDTTISDLSKYMRDEGVREELAAPDPTPTPATAPPAEEEVGLDIDELLSSVEVVVAPVAEPTPVVEEAPAPSPVVEEAPAPEAEEEAAAVSVLPDVKAEEAPAATSTLSEVEDFFNELDVSATSTLKQPSQAAPSMAELDIDDLIGAFGS